MNERVDNISRIKSVEIYTSHHTHYVIGTGAKDPQKMDPKASRETLDHVYNVYFCSSFRGWKVASRKFLYTNKSK